jgi:hypothetical protein
VSTASWPARTAVALAIGAAGEGGCALLAIYVSGAFAVATIAVAIVIGWYFGPVFGGVAAGFPPVGIAFVPSDDYIGQRISAALAVILLLGGCAWLTGRVRERYGDPPWAQSRGTAE